MILCIEYPKDSVKKFLELVNEVGKVAGYKINIQKAVALLYANNELTERQIKKTSHSQLLQKRIKHLGINLTKDVKYMYKKNYKWEKMAGKYVEAEPSSPCAQLENLANLLRNRVNSQWNPSLY